jgi:hypothetical protein
MTDELKISRTSDMLRDTAVNLTSLLNQMADHIDALENRVAELEFGDVADSSPQ